MSDGPKFSCPECGKRYPWKPELAGKKGKCKCGSVMPIPTSAPGAPRKVMAASAVASRPRPTPKPRPQPEPEDSAFGDDGTEDLVAPPAYSPAPAMATATASATKPRATGTRYVAPAPGAVAVAEKPALKWMPALKWWGFGLLLTVWAVWELSSPTDPEDGRHRRGIRAIVSFVNMIAGPKGGFFLLAAGALFFLVTGALVLIGKVRDDDSAG